MTPNPIMIKDPKTGKDYACYDKIQLDNYREEIKQEITDIAKTKSGSTLIVSGAISCAIGVLTANPVICSAGIIAFSRGAYNMLKD